MSDTNPVLSDDAEIHKPISTSDSARRAAEVREIRERSQTKYRDIKLGEPLDEPCPGCGCVTFAAARKDVERLLEIINTAAAPADNDAESRS